METRNYSFIKCIRNASFLCQGLKKFYFFDSESSPNFFMYILRYLRIISRPYFWKYQSPSGFISLELGLWSWHLSILSLYADTILKIIALHCNPYLLIIFLKALPMKRMSNYNYGFWLILFFKLVDIFPWKHSCQRPELKVHLAVNSTSLLAPTEALRSQ